MPTRVFSEEERNFYREKMLEAGFGLIQQYGIKHMSIDKITKSAGIGKSTFYNFFSSKEEYVLAVIEHRRKIIPQLIEQISQGRDKLGKEDARKYLHLMIDKNISIYPYLTLEDEANFLNLVPEQSIPNLEHETAITIWMLSYLEGVKENPDYAVIANLVKIFVLASESGDLLHQEGYDRTMEIMIETILDAIFE